MYDRLRYIQGQIIAYGGGTLVGLWSKAATAADSLAETLPQFTMNDLIGLGGLLVIASRLVFDIFVYIDKRKQRKQGEQ